MIDRDLYFARSANSLRAALAVELSGVEVRKHQIDLTANEHKVGWFVRLNPAEAVPVLIEKSGNSHSLLTQSGAIMEHLFRQFRSDMWPNDPDKRSHCSATTLSALTDIAVQNTLARYLGTGNPDAAEFVFDRMISAMRAAFAPLHQSAYLCGSIATIADYAHFPVAFMRESHLRENSEFHHVIEWLERLKTENSVAKAISYSGLQL